MLLDIYTESCDWLIILIMTYLAPLEHRLATPLFLHETHYLSSEHFHRIGKCNMFPVFCASVDVASQVKGSKKCYYRSCTLHINKL